MGIDRALLRASWRSWLSNDGSHVGPHWMQWIWTLLFCAGLAAVLTVLAFASGASRSTNFTPAWWLRVYTQQWIVCTTVGSIIHLLFSAAVPLAGGPRAIRRWPNRKRTLFFGGIPLLGLLLGWPLGVELAGGDVVAWFGSRNGLRIIVGSLLIALVITFLMHHFFASKSRQFEAERRAAEARLQLLQGQMEPHFLFNTLANVQSLIDSDAPRAKAMLDAFVDYLRASVSRLRDGDGTLGDELAMAEAYLSLMRMRMGERLAYSVAADDALRTLPLPRLLLQPLVENAVMHGLEPKLDGGHVVLAARRDGRRLVLTVRDDGLGRAAPAARRAGSGVALDNLRERLQARYAGDAALTLDFPATGGAIATLTLPLDA
jgi:signal transduction histidine kinase